MTDKGPFDAAIEVLKDHSGWYRDAGGKIQYRPSTEAAIRVLKAAGKVNKKRALKLVGWLKDVGEHEDIHWSHGVDVEYVALYAFLESLPDKEGK